MADVTVKDLLDNLRKAYDEIPETISDSLFANSAKVISLQQGQLYDGKTNKNQDIRPLYTEDPFFKTPRQAQAYISWKQRLTPNSIRNPNAPNLYINGYFFNSLRMFNVAGDVIIRSSAGGEIGKLDDKYKDIFGLYEENKNYVNNEIIIPKIWELLEKYV